MPAEFSFYNSLPPLVALVPFLLRCFDAYVGDLARLCELEWEVHCLDVLVEYSATGGFACIMLFRNKHVIVTNFVILYHTCLGTFLGTLNRAANKCRFIKSLLSPWKNVSVEVFAVSMKFCIDYYRGKGKGVSSLGFATMNL